MNRVGKASRLVASAQLMSPLSSSSNLIDRMNLPTDFLRLQGRRFGGGRWCRSAYLLFGQRLCTRTETFSNRIMKEAIMYATVLNYVLWVSVEHVSNWEGFSRNAEPCWDFGGSREAGFSVTRESSVFPNPQKYLFESRLSDNQNFYTKSLENIT